MKTELVSALRGTAEAVADTYRLAGRTVIAAPLIVAIAVLPEFVQHVVEIRLGMFESRERFVALAEDPTRWAFGYGKIAGLTLAALLTARFWGLGARLGRAFAMRPVPLLKLVVAIGVMLAVSELLAWPGKQGAPAAIWLPLGVVSAVLQAGFQVLIVGLLVEDPEIGLRQAFVDRLPTAVLMLVTLVFAFGPAQLLHMVDHKLALGQPAVVVWALMIWDSLLVGLMACLIGSAMWVAYGSGASWRGWGAGTLRLGWVETVDPETGQPVRRRRSRPGPRPRR